MKKLTTKQKKILHVISMDTDVKKLWDFINDGLENKDIIIWKLAFHLARKNLLKIYGGVLFDKVVKIFIRVAEHVWCICPLTLILGRFLECFI